MTVDQIVDLLNPKNQNLPKLELKSDFAKSDITWVPVIEKKEADVAKLFSFVKKNELNGKKGEKLQVIHNNQLYYFVGLGPEKEVDSRKMRRFYGSIYLASLSTKPKTITMVTDAKWLKEATVGVLVAALNAKLINPNYKKVPVPTVELAGPTVKGPEAKKAHKAGLVLAEGKI
ncbi:hypothetical protein IPJ72_00345 [Candidatus Peregrinibacteria bacterium]|nr:MAG: hypothetical protein IPJ72_00345 [Candidatus Peregrinibacteria bacterium]